MEYWDITARFESGHRFAARFLITNEGPGSRTAAAVGHLVLPGGKVVPIKYGRTREAWTLGAEGRRIKIASAVLDLSRSPAQVEVDSDKRGIKLQLEFESTAPPVALSPLPGAYEIEALTPIPVRGMMALRGMSGPRTLQGTIAVTHTWMEDSEANLVRQRAELFAHSGEIGIYLNELILADGRRRGWLAVRRGAEVVQWSDDLALRFGDTTTTTDDSRYPLSVRWDAEAGSSRLRADLRHEWLRWAPLDIIPQPFRFLLSLQAQPRQVWADAEIELALSDAGAAAPALSGAGIGVVMFAGPAVSQ
jgi:hypothetical protein